MWRRQKSINFVLDQEGGLSTDTGGLTNHGISQKSYPSLDIKKLTRAKAETIYGNDYWRKMGCELMGKSPLGLVVLDSAVNIGRHRTGMWLQEALNLTGADLDTDGVVGIKTITAVNEVEPAHLIQLLQHRRLMHYASIARKKPYDKYLRGWVARMADLSREVGCWGICCNKAGLDI